MCALAAFVLAPPATTLRSTYTLRWLTVGLMLLAAIGRRDRRAAIATAVLAGAGGLYVAGDALVRVAGGGSAARLSYLVGGLVVFAISAVDLAFRRKRFDPVMMVSRQLAVGLVAYWLYYVISGLDLDPRSYQPESVLRAAGTELGLLALAFAAIGVGISRTWGPAADRLGWWRPAGWQVAFAVVLALVLALSNIPLDLLMSKVMPGSELAIVHVSNHVFAGVPAWSLPLIALMAGIGEETAFRGALQPRFGIVLTAALFALIHIQYGPTFVELWVFVHALIYGLVRKHINTTTAVMTHAAYDFTAFLNGAGFAAFCLAAIGLAVYLWRQAAQDPDRLRVSLRKALAEDWQGVRQRRYLSP